MIIFKSQDWYLQMNQQTFNQFIKKGQIQGPSRYAEYWFVYQNAPDSGVVLDLGAGKSALPLALKEKGLKVFCTEIDPACRFWQESRGIKCFMVKDTLPFKDETFDAVITASSMEHFDPDNDGDIPFIKEAYRVLKLKGLFILTMPVDSYYIKNQYKGKKHPPEKIYSEEEYAKRFLPLFKEVKRDFLLPEIEFTERNGLLAVLQKD